MSSNEQLAAYLRPGAPDGPPLEMRACDGLREQGIAPVLYETLRRRRLFEGQLPAVRDALARAAREEALLEPFRRDGVVEVIAALADAGVRAIIFKGTGLAYTCYPEPFLRPRLDTDLLVRREDVDRASAVFERLQFSSTLQTSGEYVTYQRAFARVTHGVQIAFDVHWKLANPQAFADLFSFDELERDSVGIPALGSSARTVSDVHALLIACMHRVAHHHDREMLLDAYDIALLAGRLGRQDWNAVSAGAESKGLCRVTGRGLALASSLLDAAVPADVVGTLARAGAREPTAAYLRGGLRKIDLLTADLARLAWRGRLRLLREHLFPAPAFVLGSYRQTSPGLVPVLYMVRIVRGAASWFRPLR